MRNYHFPVNLSNARPHSCATELLREPTLPHERPIYGRTLVPIFNAADVYCTKAGAYALVYPGHTTDGVLPRSRSHLATTFGEADVLAAERVVATNVLRALDIVNSFNCLTDTLVADLNNDRERPKVGPNENSGNNSRVC